MLYRFSSIYYPTRARRGERIVWPEISLIQGSNSVAENISISRMKEKRNPSKKDTSAVDVYGGTYDVTGLLRGKEQHRPDDVLRICYLSSRNRLVDFNPI